MNVSGQADVLLPENNPVTAENDEKPHEAADTRQHRCQQRDPDPPRYVDREQPHKNSQHEGHSHDRQHQTIVAHHGTEIPPHGGYGWGRCIPGFPRFAEEKQYHEERNEYAERCDAVDILYTEMAMGPRRKERPKRATNVDHGVINRIADRTDVLF